MGTADRMRVQGTRLLLDGRLRVAAALLARAVLAAPDDAEARHNLALALRALGDRHAALEQAQAAVYLSPEPASRSLLGSLLLLCGHSSEALTALRQAACTGYGPALYQLGVAQWMLGATDDATHTLQQALRRPLSPLLRARTLSHLVELSQGKQPGALDLCSVPLTSALRRPMPSSVSSTAPTTAPPVRVTAQTAQGLAALIASSAQVVALTGAGISAGSGLATRKQLWERHSRDEAVSVWRFHENPAYLWRVIADFLGATDTPQPNAAHRALAALPVSTVITQNIDNLHQQAGSASVIELHGSFSRTYCHQCGAAGAGPVRQYLHTSHPPRCACGGPIRPDVVLFGEPVPQAALAAAVRAVQQADLLLVVGCAMDVAPAADLPRLAAEAGTRVVALNVVRSRLPQTLSVEHLAGPAEQTLPAVLSAFQAIQTAREPQG